MNFKKDIPIETYVPAELLQGKKLPVVVPAHTSQLGTIAFGLGMLVVFSWIWGASRWTVLVWAGSLQILVMVLLLFVKKRK